MSWISDLAGRAEDFLVKIDQNAAVAAQAVRSKENHKKSPSTNHSRSGSLASAASDFSSNPVADVVTSTSVKPSPSMSDLSKAIGGSKTSKMDRDAALMASLNVSVGSLSAEISEVGNGDLNLQQENNLLKQEIKSLSQEIRQAMQCAKQAEKGKS